MWDSKDDLAITRARLAVSTPESVYGALKTRGEWIEHNKWGVGSSDDDLERLLFERNDPLIHMGLAQYARAAEVVAPLYDGEVSDKRSKAYMQGLRVACLSNRNVGSALIFGDGGNWMGKQNLYKLVTEGADADIYAWLRNPSAGKYLEELYMREETFSHVTDERWFRLVQASQGNSRINVDTSDEHGPDLTSWGIQKGILNLLRVAPTEEHWIRFALRPLLDGLDPRLVRTPDKDIDDILDRWSKVSIKGLVGDDKNKEAEGHYTSLTEVQEFCCLIAALYGKLYEKKSFKILGSPDDESVVRRCAYYGNADMSAEEIKSGFSKDNAVFSFAALYNENLFYTRETRAALEDTLSGALRYIYARRYDQIRAHRPAFNPKPVSDDSAGLLDDVIDLPKPSEELVSIARLEQMMRDTNKKLNGLSGWVTWGFIVIGVILLWRS